MAEERSTSRRLRDNFSIIFAFLLVGLGLSTYRQFVRTNFVASIILLITSTLSMVLTFRFWRKFTEKYAPDIIYWSTQQKWMRKLVAGGSFSYYEYKENIYKIGLFEPVSRFLSMMIAFMGLASTFAKIAGTGIGSPAEDLYSALFWAVLILIIPLILTPIVPIIWAMEDLQLKSWNAKRKTNLTVSRRYKARFNSIIAIGSLGVAFGLSLEGASLSNPDQLLQPLQDFGVILATAIEVLVYPISVLTLLYYLYFRGTVIEKIRDKMTIPIAETRLLYRDLSGNLLNMDGEIIAENPQTDNELLKIVDENDSGDSSEGNEAPKASLLGVFSRNRVLIDKTEVESETKEGMKDDPSPSEVSKELSEKPSEKGILSKTGEKITTSSKNLVEGIGNVGKSIGENTFGRLRKKDKSKEVTPSSSKDKSGGSATAGLWEKNENKEKKSKGGSATRGLWDNNETKKNK